MENFPFTEELIKVQETGYAEMLEKAKVRMEEKLQNVGDTMEIDEDDIPF